MTARRVRALMEAHSSGWVARGLVGPTSDELRSLCRDAGWRFVELVLTDVGDKPALMTALAESFALPSYFGRNWDAFEECLGDQLAECAGTVVRLKGSVTAANGEGQTLVDILDSFVHPSIEGAHEQARVGAGSGEGAGALVIVADPPLPVRV